MANSKVGICNIALASLGAEAIRSFDEDNVRSRMVDVFYESVRAYMLSKFDWPFARGFAKLNLLDTSAEEIPSGMYQYAVPNECLTPRDLYPPGSRTYWELIGDRIQCKLSSSVYLYYTKKFTDASKFSSAFVSVLALALAVRMAPALTQDKKLMTALARQLVYEMNECWETDANIGNDYRAYDEDPNNDTFVNPDLSIVIDSAERSG